jgi:ankyrin repeat protein
VYSHQIRFILLVSPFLVSSQFAFSMEKEEEWKSKQLIVYQSRPTDASQKNILFQNNSILSKGTICESIGRKQPVIQLPKPRTWAQWASNQWPDEPFLEYSASWPLPLEISVEIIKKIIDDRSKKKLTNSVKSILNLASTNKTFNVILNSPFVMETLLKSVHINAALSLVAQMKNMRVMCRPEMKQWRNTKKKIANTKKLFEMIRSCKKGCKKTAIQKLIKDENIYLDWINKSYDTTVLGEVIRNSPGKLTITDQEEIISMLLDAGANINGKNPDDYIPLSWINGDDDLRIAEILIKAGANPNNIDYYGWTPLIQAVKRNAVEIVKMLLAKGAKLTINNINKHGNSALFYSVKNTMLTKMLLDAGADPKQQKDIVTEAARLDNLEIVTLLIEVGADINGKNEYGGTALLNAAARGNDDIVRVLLKAHALVDIINRNGEDALNLASNRGRTKIVRMLIDAGSSVNQIDNYGANALIEAAKQGNVEIVRLLIDAGANVMHKDNQKWDALMWAAHKGHREMVEIIEEAKFKEWRKKKEDSTESSFEEKKTEKKT